MVSIVRLLRNAIVGACAFGSIIAAAWPHEAEAESVSSLIINGFNFASDEDRTYLVDRVVTAPGQIDVGDSLRGSFNINTLNSNGANLGGATPNNEWTGIYQFLVAGKTVLPGGLVLFTFAPDPAFAASLCGGVASCTATQPQMAAIVPGVGAMIVMFEDTNHNFAGDFDEAAAAGLPASDDGPGGPIARATPPLFDDLGSGFSVTEEAFVARAADGTRFWTLGFTNGVPDGPGSAVPGPGEGFIGVAISGDNILVARTVTAGTGFILNNGGLNRIGNGVAETGDPLLLGTVISPFAGAGVVCNPPALPCGTVQFAFTGSTRGVFDLDTAFEASSNIDAAFFITTPRRKNDSEIPGSVLVFPKFITGTVNVGTPALPVPAPRTSFEISVTCPADTRCAEFSRVKLLAHWVCPASQDGVFKFICQEADFELFTTVKGTVWFNPENVPFAMSPSLSGGAAPAGTATNPAPVVPAPPCERGYLIVWAISPDDANNPRAISFNGLIGNAVIREGDNSASAYNAIPIQSVQPTGTLLDPTDPDRTLVFDGLTEYAQLPGRVLATVRADRDFVSGREISANTSAIDSFITLLTIDVNSNRSNLPVFVDLDFFNEVETLRSTFTEFICWMEKSLSRNNPRLYPDGFINTNLREPFGRKLLVESGQAVKQQIFGVSDPDCPSGTCPVTLLGLIETKERGIGGPNAPYVREYSYTMFHDGSCVATRFHPN
jgi:hypothetical protein